MKNNRITYIIDTKDNTTTLYSVVETKYGGPARNYVASGSAEYIVNLKEKLEQE